MSFAPYGINLPEKLSKEIELEGFGSYLSRVKVTGGWGDDFRGTSPRVARVVCKVGGVEEESVKKNLMLLGLAVAFGTTLVLLGCASGQHPPDDAVIVAAVQSQLYQNPQLKPLDVHVTSDHGVVTLTGEVHTSLEQLAIEGLAQKAPGAKQVIDQLTIAADADAPASSPAANPAPATGSSEVAAHPSRRHRAHAKVHNDSEMAMND